jgi:acyl-coenzyme A synthetase/AMP-(fatty) acid ligase
MGNVLFPLLTDTVVVYPLAALPPSGNMVADVLDHNKVDIVCLIPTVIEQIRRDPDLLNRISAKVSRMMWSGGDIPAQAGDALSSRFELFNQMGATELGLFHQIAPAGKWGGSNWHYLGFHPDSNVRFVHREGEVYEAVIRRKDHGYTQTIFHVFPDKQEYATGDLYKMHPTEPDLWDFQGRNDDMIVLASSEKFWPVAVEKLIVQHPNVRDAVVIGTGRVRPVLLLDVESAQNVGLEKVLADVWPVIEATHAICSPAARIQKEFIVVVDPARPLVRTAKGNVQRAATTKLYADDLARLDEKVRVAAPAAAMEVLAEGTRM